LTKGQKKQGHDNYPNFMKFGCPHFGLFGKITLYNI